MTARIIAVGSYFFSVEQSQTLTCAGDNNDDDDRRDTFSDEIS